MVRAMFSGSDHLSALMIMEVHNIWMFRKQLREEKTGFAFENLIVKK